MKFSSLVLFCSQIIFAQFAFAHVVSTQVISTQALSSKATSAQVTSAHGLTGSWSGQGTIKINGVLQNEPCRMILNIEHTDKTFCVLKSEFKCPGMNIVNKNQTVLQIVDGQLKNGDLVLGTITEIEMHSHTVMPDGRMSDYLIQLVKPEELFYKDSVEWVKGYVTEIEGVLTP